MKNWKDAILGKSTAGRIAMGLLAILLVVVAISVLVGCSHPAPATPAVPVITPQSIVDEWGEDPTLWPEATKIAYHAALKGKS